MRLHKALILPELVYPAPFASDPSYQDNSVCVFTSRGSHQLRVVSSFLIGLAIFGLLVAVLSTLGGSITTFVRTNYRGIWAPMWIMYPLGVFTLVFGIKWLLKSNRRRQVLIDRQTNRAQIQSANGTSTNSNIASITLTVSDLVTGSHYNHNDPSSETKQGKFTLVAIDAGQDYYILSAFKYSESAQQFANEMSELTGLPLSDTDTEELRRVEGERMMLFRSTDKHALAHRKRGKPMKPIMFR